MVLRHSTENRSALVRLASQQGSLFPAVNNTVWCCPLHRYNFSSWHEISWHAQNQAKVHRSDGNRWQLGSAVSWQTKIREIHINFDEHCKYNVVYLSSGLVTLQYYSLILHLSNSLSSVISLKAIIVSVVSPQVSRIFQHKSIGAPIYFVVVKLVLLEKDPVRWI